MEINDRMCAKLKLYPLTLIICYLGQAKCALFLFLQDLFKIMLPSPTSILYEHENTRAHTNAILIIYLIQCLIANFSKSSDVQQN